MTRQRLACEDQEVVFHPAGRSRKALVVFLIIQLASFLAPLLATPISDCPARRAQPITFAVSGARSGFVLSSDGTRVLFAERGQLKAVRLKDGLISVLRDLPSEYPDCAAIPGRPTTIVVAAQIGGYKSPHQVWLVRFSAADEIPVDVGESGSDGSLLVSDSGRYLATGTDYECSGGERDCFARTISVFSTASGQRLFSTPIPCSESVEENPDQGTETRRSSQLSRAAWARGDVLVLEFDEGPSKAFARGPSGSWRPLPVIPVAPRRSGRDSVYGPTANLVTLGGVSLGTAELSCYFGSELGVVQILRGPNLVVLFKVLPPVSPGEFPVSLYSFRGLNR